MLTIGLLGGMSWESTAEYYRLINHGVRERLGGTHSARMLMLSVDFAEIEALQQAGDWDGLGRIMLAEARRLKSGGADFLVIATNTMHRFADEVEAEAAIPVLHIADAMGAAIAAQGFARIGLLGTRFTMEQPFLKARLADRFGITSLVPDAADRATIHGVIYDELVKGMIRPESREACRAVMARLAEAGAEAIVLACTEIMLLVQPGDSARPLFDTTALHAAAAVERALS